MSTGLPNGGGVLIEFRNTTVINGKMIWVLAKNLAKSISTTVLTQTQDSIYSVTTLSYEAYTDHNNWFMSNVGFIGNSIAFRYGPCGESIISYYNVSNYPGGNLTNYLNYLKWKN